MATPIKFSSNHYMLGGVVYSADLSRGDHSALQAVAATTNQAHAAAATASAYGLVLPGESGTLLGTTYANGSPVYTVKFSSGTVEVSGKFITLL